jgi:hypothetical protein
MTNLVFLLLSLQLAGSDGGNYEAVRVEKRLTAIRTSEPITIDGRLTEAAWTSAAVGSDFVQSEPKEGQPATEQTEVRVLHDSRNIYFGVRLHDSQARRVVIGDLKKDFSGENGDNFEIVLDTFHDRRNGYVFWTNAAGAKGDSQMVNEGRENNANWDAVWYVKTELDEDGWIAEIAIPFKSLKFREDEVQTWGINFHRNLRSDVRNEDSFWSPLPRIYGINRVSLAGTLEGLEGIKPGSNFRLKPYVTASYAQNRVAGINKRDGDFGFDAKYGITAGLTWDFTYNTDFSQVEADEQQINLTRFNLFFPEKREFFLENSGIFKFGGDTITLGGGGGSGRGAGSDVFFFSRTIGISPDNEAVPILGGTRLTGRTGAYEIGVLTMQQRGYKEFNPTNFTVGRLKRNILANSDIGVMVLNKEVKDSGHFNRVVGTDANLRFGQDLTVNAFVAKSSTPGVHSDDMLSRIGFAYQDRTWQFKSAYSEVQENFNNEMGYFPRKGVKRYDQGFHYAYRPNSSIVRLIQPHVVFNYIADRNGNFDSKYYDYHLPITFQNGSWMEMGENGSVEVLRKPFSLNNGRAVVPPGTYDQPEYFFSMRLDQSRRLYPSGRFGYGPFYGGHKYNYNLSSTFRVNYKMNISLSYTQNHIDLPTDNGRFKTHLLTTRVNYSFSTNMFLNALMQYNSDSRQWSSNIRFNVIHRPLSDFFVVYNERRNSTNGDLNDRAIIAKLTYMISK